MATEKDGAVAVAVTIEGGISIYAIHSHLFSDSDPFFCQQIV